MFILKVNKGVPSSHRTHLIKHVSTHTNFKQDPNREKHHHGFTSWSSPTTKKGSCFLWNYSKHLFAWTPWADCEAAAGFRGLAQLGTVWHLAGRRSALWLGVSTPALADGLRRDGGELVTQTPANSWNNPQHTGGAAIQSHTCIHACTQRTQTARVCVCYVTEVDGLYRWISRTPTIHRSSHGNTQ